MKKNKNGFSLIELLVSLIVIMILTGIGVTSFSSLSKTKKIATFKNELSSWIKLSQNLAVTRQYPDETLGLDFVKLTIASGNLTVSGVKTDDSTKTFFIKSVADDLSGEGVSVSVSLPSKSITTFGFKNGSGRLVDSAGNFIVGPVTIKLTYNSSTDSIVINDLGIINEK